MSGCGIYVSTGQMDSHQFHVTKQSKLPTQKELQLKAALFENKIIVRRKVKCANHTDFNDQFVSQSSTNPQVHFSLLPQITFSGVKRVEKLY